MGRVLGRLKTAAAGISSRSTIVEHHFKYFNHPNALPARIEGNPFREEIDRAGEIVSGHVELYAVNVVSIRGDQIPGFAGPLETSYSSALKASRKAHVRKVGKRFDTIILDARPLTILISMYQATKAFENNLRVLNNGGLAILLAECREGIGPAGFIKALRSGISGMDKQGNIVPYLLADHLQRKLEERDAKLLVVTSNVEEEVWGRIEATRNLEKTAREVADRAKRGLSTLIVQYASRVVLVV